jgi:hypothetical protein
VELRWQEMLRIWIDGSRQLLAHCLLVTLCAMLGLLTTIALGRSSQRFFHGRTPFVVRSTFTFEAANATSPRSNEWLDRSLTARKTSVMLPVAEQGGTRRFHMTYFQAGPRKFFSGFISGHSFPCTCSLTSSKLASYVVLALMDTAVVGTTLTAQEALSGVWGSISLAAWIFLLVRDIHKLSAPPRR